MNPTLSTRKWLIAGVAVASLQTAALGAMVWDRIQLLKHGREIVLPIVPVDPRSLFRGDYVILSYDVQNVPAELITADLRDSKPKEFYVTLEQVAEVWKPVALSAAPQPAAAARISVKARTRYGWWPSPAPRPVGSQSVSPQPQVLQVRYGIESYFVAEGRGKPLEQTAREKKLAAVIAVDAKGNAAIKGLEIDGRRVYDEPLL